MELQQLLDIAAEITLNVLGQVFQTSKDLEQLAALVRSTLAPHFSYNSRKLIQHHITACPLPCQLRQLLATTVIVASWRHDPPSLRDASTLLEQTMNNEQPMLTPPVSMDPADFFSDWLELRLEAHNYLKEFSRNNLHRAYHIAFERRDRDFTQLDLQPVEAHRILRSYMRFQLLFRMSLIGTEAARNFVSTLTPWELEELRSVNEFLKYEYQRLLQGVDSSDLRLRGIPARPDSDIWENSPEICPSPTWLLNSRYISFFEPQPLDSMIRNKFEYLVSPFIEARQNMLDEPLRAKLSLATKSWSDSPRYIGYGLPGMHGSDSDGVDNPYTKNTHFKTIYRGQKVHRKIYHNWALRCGYVFWTPQTLRARNWWDRITAQEWVNDFWTRVAFWYGERRVVDGRTTFCLFNDLKESTKWFARHRPLSMLEDSDSDDDDDSEDNLDEHLDDNLDERIDKHFDDDLDDEESDDDSDDNLDDNWGDKSDNDDEDD